jgi:hypothetical protein
MHAGLPTRHGELLALVVPVEGKQQEVEEEEEGEQWQQEEGEGMRM